MLSIELPAPSDYQLLRSMSGLSPGRGDPTTRQENGSVALCLLTPDGSATVHARLKGGALHGEIYGDGAAWLEPHLQNLFGLNDDLSGFEPAGPLRGLAADLSGIRLPRLPVVFHRLVQVVLHQLVSWEEAADGWRAMTRRYGEPAPGPGDLMVGPSPDCLRELAYFDLVDCGILPRQARLIVRLAREARRIERMAEKGDEYLARFLHSIPGIGKWTVQSLLGSGRGDSDAVVTGDYGLHHSVCWFFKQQPRGTDEEMLELLEPYRGHRYRVQNLIMRSGLQAPRRGPKMAYGQWR